MSIKGFGTQVPSSSSTTVCPGRRQPMTVSPKSVKTEGTQKTKPEDSGAEPTVSVPTTEDKKMSAQTRVGLPALLDKAESASYNQLVHPKKKGAPSIANLTKMPIEEVRALQTRMTESGAYPSSAVGKYQIIAPTLNDAVKALRLDPKSKFDEATQDRIFREYLISKKRPQIESYISGQSNDIKAAQLALAREFASFPVPSEIYRQKSAHWDARVIKPGQSYYTGAASNKALVTMEESAKALEEERRLRLGASSHQGGM